MEQDMPTIIITIVVCLIIIAIGSFVIITFVTEGGIDSHYTQTFDVDNPSVDLTVTLKYKPSEKPTVYQYNTIEWVLVDAAHISYLDEQVTVAAAGMQG